MNCGDVGVGIVVVPNVELFARADVAVLAVGCDVVLVVEQTGVEHSSELSKPSLTKFI